MTAETFEIWLKEHLLPISEDVVALDNLKLHKTRERPKSPEKRNCTIRSLPPYSPNINPIDNAYQLIEAPLRKLAERTIAGLRARKPADLFNPANTKIFSFDACGDDSTRSGFTLAKWIQNRREPTLGQIIRLDISVIFNLGGVPVNIPHRISM